MAFLSKYDVPRDILSQVMEGVYSSELSEEVFQYMYAVEDFDVFNIFMNETNLLLDSQTGA